MTFASWRFLATPVAGDGAGGAAVPASGPSPDVRFYGLATNTKASRVTTGSAAKRIASLSLRSCMTLLLQTVMRHLSEWPNPSRAACSTKSAWSASC